MKLLKEYELGNVSELNTTDCLDVIESFLVRRAISGIEPTGLLALFRTAWNNMKGNPTKENLKVTIKIKNTIEWPDDQRFHTSIITRNIYSSHISKYVLIEYEKSLGSDIPGNEYWIEHEMPQPLNEEWEKVITIEEHQNVVHTWGNLIPLTAEMNRGVSQSEFKLKKDEFNKNSVFSSARKLASEYDIWDKEQIQNRSAIISE